MATLSVLERKIDKRLKENADQMKVLKHELQTLKTLPKLPKVHRPSTETTKTKEASKMKKSEATKAPTKKPDEKRLDCWLDPKMSKRTKLQHHLNDGDGEMNKQNAQADAAGTYTTSSSVSLVSETDSVTSKINYKGSSMRINCSPLKLIQFLVMDLKMKLKDFVPEGNREVSKVLKEINYAIKQVKMEHGMKESSTNQTKSSQTTQMQIGGNSAAKGKQITSKDVQTDLRGDEVEKLREIDDKYLENQLKLDVNLRHIEDMFTLELSKSSEKIVKLTSEIHLLQSKLNDEISSSEKATVHRVDLKIEEIMGEMKFLRGVIDETRNHNLIDNMHKKLEQTNKKVDDVKRKCTEAAKHCLRMQLENLLINTTTPKANEIGHELGIIKSNFGREIAALKCAVSGDVSKCHRHRARNLASSSYASTISVGTAPSESIKSQAQWNEKMEEISSNDKFSTIIDDGRDPKGGGGGGGGSFDRRRHLMMEQEINNASRRNYSESSDANESIGVTSLMALPQDESFN